MFLCIMLFVNKDCNHKACFHMRYGLGKSKILNKYEVTEAIYGRMGTGIIWTNVDFIYVVLFDNI